ncbi:MAG: hypothetical protein JXA42_20175 [Anaerolineales bacterium]|nr:hypothetical protein [Anaerolineales bacterium]
MSTLGQLLGEEVIRVARQLNIRLDRCVQRYACQVVCKVYKNVELGIKLRQVVTCREVKFQHDAPDSPESMLVGGPIGASADPRGAPLMIFIFFHQHILHAATHQRRFCR